MNRNALEWYALLARGLVWVSGIVLLLALIAAVVVAGSDSAIPGLENAEKQGRGFFALAALGGGVASAGLLAGLGAILRLMVEDRLAKLDPGPEAERDEPDLPPPLPAIEPRERRRRAEPKKPRKPAERKPRKPAEQKPRGREEE